MKNPYSDRKEVIGFIFIAIAAIYVLRMFIIQVINDEFKISANNNAMRRVIVSPDRGLIFDRNGKPLLENESV